ncbi:hotdog domain-containing protein [Peribacillus sp. CSMR9]|uniref:hotdog domain-containing protein n=1 Tax=Peribacillus sp. CSMR9 TaxID=2981350 RepID=UPI003988BE2F
MKITYGGMIATMIDSGMGALQTQHVHKGTVTTDFQVRYVKPSNGDRLKCTSKLIIEVVKRSSSRGRSTIMMGNFMLYRQEIF